MRVLSRSRGQKIRGLKHRQHRPSLIIADDVEGLDWVRTQENRDKSDRCSAAPCCRRSASTAVVFKAIFGSAEKDTIPVNAYEGFKSDGSVVLRDRRGTRKAEIPEVSTKSETLGDDPLAIYKPTGAKHVDAAKAVGNFTGWTYAAVNAIASEVANIQLWLYKWTATITRSRKTTRS